MTVEVFCAKYCNKTKNPLKKRLYIYIQVLNLLEKRANSGTLNILRDYFSLKFFFHHSVFV